MTLKDVLHRQEFLEAYTVSICTPHGRHGLCITDSSLGQSVSHLNWDIKHKHLDIHIDV